MKCCASSGADRASLDASVIGEMRSEIRELFEQLFEFAYVTKPAMRRTASFSVAKHGQVLPPRIGEWDFDPFDVADADAKDALVAIAMDAFETAGLVTGLQLSRSRLQRLLGRVADAYVAGAKPYHGVRHAIHVMHSVHVMWTKSGAASSKDLVAGLALYFAALCHDLGHSGVTNRFLVATNDARAVRYNGVSPQENHHATAALALLSDADCDFFAGSCVQGHTVVAFKRAVVQLILATNIADHLVIVDAFSPSDSMQCMKLILKCADLSHTFSPLEAHLRWVALLEEEFFAQGDAEDAIGLPVTASFDRRGRGIAKTQAAFFDVIVAPMFAKLVDAYPAMAPLGALIGANHGHWQEVRSASPTM
jgi:hypothetical protein